MTNNCIPLDLFEKIEQRHQVEATIYYITSSALAILLILSEVLSWSKCKANSISQLCWCSSSVDDDDDRTVQDDDDEIT